MAAAITVGLYRFPTSFCTISTGRIPVSYTHLAGTESKSETEKLLRQAMDDYESKKFIAKSENITVGELLDIWAEEELKTGTLSNGTVQNYLGAITNIKKHPISERKLKNVTSEHLQAFFDLLSFGGTYPDGSERKGYSKDYIRSFSAVLQQSFRFAVSPKQYITFNPMQYIKLKYQTDEVDLFSDDDMDGDIQPIPREDYERLIVFLQNYNPPAILPIQIAYYAGPVSYTHLRGSFHCTSVHPYVSGRSDG